MNFFRKPQQISWKLTLVYSLMFIIVLIALNIFIYFSLNRYVDNNIKSNINNTMQLMISQLQNTSWLHYEVLGVDIMQEISEIEGNMYFRILDYEGEVIAQSQILEGIDLPITRGFNEIQKDNINLVYNTTEIPRSTFFNGYLQVIRDKRSESHFMDLLFSTLVIASIVGGVGAIIIGYVVTRKTLQPISEITNSVKKISASDLNRRLEVEGPEDELTELAHTFNSMLDRLEEAFYRQQQFVSDASHELRTPISVIQGYVDLLDRWGKEETKVRDEAIEAIKNEVSNIKSIMESLLFLARGDREEIKMEREKFSVNKLISEIIREISLLDNDDLNVEAEIEDEVSYYGDRRLIKQMLRSFIDNSLKYTPAGGEIKIRAEEADKLKLQISDTGCGIPEGDIPHIFERFYQVDKARSSEEGVGLGLSIAHWIVKIHEGEIEVDSEVGEGTTINIWLPDLEKKN